MSQTENNMDDFISDVPSGAVEKVFDDPALTVPAADTLWKAELAVDDAVTDLRLLPEAEFSPSAITYAVVENGVGVVESVGNGVFSIPIDILEGLKEDVRAAEFAAVTAPMASFTISGWQYKGEQGRWALDYEREHGTPPSYLECMEFANQYEHRDRGRSDAVESLDEICDAKTEESSPDSGEDLEGRADLDR